MALEVVGKNTDELPDLFDSETGDGLSDLFEESSMEWIISPDQFVDFWVAAIFLLVGTWQVITILFLLGE